MVQPADGPGLGGRGKKSQVGLGLAPGAGRRRRIAVRGLGEVIGLLGGRAGGIPHNWVVQDAVRPAAGAEQGLDALPQRGVVRALSIQVGGAVRPAPSPALRGTATWRVSVRTSWDLREKASPFHARPPGKRSHEKKEITLRPRPRLLPGRSEARPLHKPIDDRPWHVRCRGSRRPVRGSAPRRSASSPPRPPPRPLPRAG